MNGLFEDIYISKMQRTLKYWKMRYKDIKLRTVDDSVSMRHVSDRPPIRFAYTNLGKATK